MEPLETQYGSKRSPRKVKTKKRTALKKVGKNLLTCIMLLDLVRRFPDIARQVCCYPKQSTSHSLMKRVPARNTVV